MDALVDTNVYLGRWPYRRLRGDDTPALVAKLRSQGVVQAWAGSFEGLFQRDLASVNERLVDECRQHGSELLLPVGSVNPTLPNWEEDLRRCREVYAMRAIRLHPNYHGYRLDAPEFARVLVAACEAGLVVQLALSMEDERTQWPLARLPHVEPAPLAALIKTLPKLKLVLLNVFRSVPIIKTAPLAEAGQVYFDIAMLEGVGGVSKLIEQVTAERIVFGSYFPQFYFESALLKLKESPLAGFQIQAISNANARKILA